MNTLNISTGGGNIKVIADIISSNQNKEYIQLSPYTNYKLQIYPKSGNFVDMDITGALNDNEGQIVVITFPLISDPTFCSTYCKLKFGYTNYDNI
jgi:hypothetical protein